MAGLGGLATEGRASARPSPAVHPGSPLALSTKAAGNHVWPRDRPPRTLLLRRLRDHLPAERTYLPLRPAIAIGSLYSTIRPGGWALSRPLKPGDRNTHHQMPRRDRIVRGHPVAARQSEPVRAPHERTTEQRHVQCFRNRRCCIGNEPACPGWFNCSKPESTTSSFTALMTQRKTPLLVEPRIGRRRRPARSAGSRTRNASSSPKCALQEEATMRSVSTG